MKVILEHAGAYIPPIELRDYLAFQYIETVGVPLNLDYYKSSAENAYKWADAMMEARK